jgi:hypothetical protein
LPYAFFLPSSDQSLYPGLTAFDLWANHGIALWPGLQARYQVHLLDCLDVHFKGTEIPETFAARKKVRSPANISVSVWPSLQSCRKFRNIFIDMGSLRLFSSSLESIPHPKLFDYFFHDLLVWGYRNRELVRSVFRKP